jgi:hypothetical protein
MNVHPYRKDSIMPRWNSTADLVYTWHAVERMRTLRITAAEVEETVRAPEQTWPGRSGVRGPTRHLVGRWIIVLLAADGQTVVTVKLRSAVPYVHGAHHRDLMPGGQAAA